MNKYLKICSPFVFLISLILLLICRKVPSGKLWKNYSVICVPAASSDSLVMAAIEEAGIKNAVALSGQYLPLALPENSIEIAMLRLNYSSSEYAYINQRKAIFFDKSQTYRLYYIPQQYSAETSTLIKLLEAQGIACIKDSSASYPWLLPVIVLLLALMLFLFVKNKLPYIAGAIIPVLYIWCNPFYPIATATCLLLLCIFFASNVWKRRDALACLLSRHADPAMLVIALIASFSTSVVSGFLFLCVLAGTAGAMTFCWFLEDFIRNRKPFVPVYIRSARRISLFAGKAFTLMSIVTGAVALLIILIFLTSSNSVKSTSSSKLLFPGNSAFSDSALPQFEDYYRWTWNVKTSPYLSLNESENGTDTISFSSYVENPETGLISEEKRTMKYDEAFKKEIYNGIDSLPFNSTESLMKSEGEGFNCGYTAASSYQINLFGIIMCFICLFILLFIWFSIIIRKGINK